VKVYVVIAITLVIIFVMVDQTYSPDDYLTVEQNANDLCFAKRGADQPPLPFRYDGCTLWLNGNWTSCCAVHDAVYWCGGDAEDRREADIALGECVNSKTPVMGSLMSYGVRLAGTPWIPWSFRWGFGWEFGKGYE